ncbi:uncharacterized protein N7518_007626 [Penicillium psychrosexuale]|uniref:uncharacterized protein n=1 Tax=Penicillium psychrosexuale TaxID=1002107 RepID=UPI0025454248|nr:uncharacterized protein N7518_007626 [Penicillium psychrosexuale]KAJ5790615.1 hypothetical protein N7518_007626 [Penicillium psychrosexuale]
MASNSTQNETPAWLNSVLPGAYGLIGLVVVVALVFWAIRLLALEARLRDPQRALTDHFVRQVAEIKKAEKAARKMEEKKKKTKEKDERKIRWTEWLLELFFGFVELSLSTNAMLRRLGSSSSSNRETDHPVFHVIVEESGASTAEAEAELEDIDCDGIVIRWVRVPRGYRLPPKSKKASTLAEVVGALQGRK